MVPCRMNVEGTWSDACIHNVSFRGMMLSANRPPRTGSYVDIRRGTVVIIGRVIWVKERQFGVSTQDAVSAAALTDEPVLRQRPQSSQAPRDRRMMSRDQTEQAITARAERSRQFASRFQFMVFVIGGGIVATFAAIQVYHIIAAPLREVATTLDGG